MVEPPGARPGRRVVPQPLRRVPAAGRRGAAQGGRPLGRSGVRRVPAPQGHGHPDRRLLQQRHRVAGSEGPEVRPHLRALRNVPRRPAGREDVLRRVDPDPQRRREPQARRLPAVDSRHPGRAAARGGGSAVGARALDADGSDGRAVPRGRSAARLPGRRRQPAQRSAHPSAEGHQEDLLQELHGRPRERGHPAARRARHGSGPGAPRVGRRLSGLDAHARNLSRPRARVRPHRIGLGLANGASASARRSDPPTPASKKPRPTSSACSP